MNRYIKMGLSFAGGFVCCGVLTTVSAVKLIGGAAISEAFLDSIRPKKKISYMDQIRNRTYRPRPGHSFHFYEEILFESRLEAEYVLESLEKIIADYGVVTVLDFYDLCGLTAPGSFTAANNGWTNLNRARIIRKRDGYVLDLPRLNYHA